MHCLYPPYHSAHSHQLPLHFWSLFLGLLSFGQQICNPIKSPCFALPFIFFMHQSISLVHTFAPRIMCFFSFFLSSVFSTRFPDLVSCPFFSPIGLLPLFFFLSMTPKTDSDLSALTSAIFLVRFLFFSCHLFPMIVLIHFFGHIHITGVLFQFNVLLPKTSKLQCVERADVDH